MTLGFLLIFSMQKSFRSALQVRQIPEEAIISSIEYKSLQSQFSVLYNESVQIRQQLEECRNQLATAKTAHLKQIEQMEVSFWNCNRNKMPDDDWNYFYLEWRAASPKAIKVQYEWNNKLSKCYFCIGHKLDCFLHHFAEPQWFSWKIRQVRFVENTKCCESNSSRT